MDHIIVFESADTKVASFHSHCQQCAFPIIPDDVIVFDGDGWIHEECA